MRMIEGWRRIDNRRGYLNVATGQKLVVTKREFGEHYLIMLFSTARNGDEGRRVSPEFATESKAEAFAAGWMTKHPRGAE